VVDSGLQSNRSFISAPEALKTSKGIIDPSDQLARQQALLEGIVNSLPVGLHVVDRDYNIVAWNRNREDGVYGIKRQDALGKSIFDVLRKQPREKIEEEFERVFETGQIDRMEASTVIDGLRRHFLISKIPMKLAGDDSTSHVITVAEDITERKQMLEKASASEKLAAIGQLAAGVVHEINNPLATIAVCAEALSSRLNEAGNLPAAIRDAFQEYLTIIETEAYRCKKITNSLLDFSRTQSSNKESLDINLIIDQTLFLLKHSKQLRQVTVSCNLSHEIDRVWGNDGQLKQAFMALIINSADAMASGGELFITSDQISSGAHTQVIVEFKDTGCGIDPDHMAKIFDPFFTTKSPRCGTGLGLSICYGIITEHGGEITVTSTVGLGSTFRVLLPISRDARKGPDEQNREKMTTKGQVS